VVWHLLLPMMNIFNKPWLLFFNASYVSWVLLVEIKHISFTMRSTVNVADVANVAVGAVIVVYVLWC